MSSKVLLLVVMVLAAIAAGVYTCREFNRTNPTVEKMKPAYVIQASELINEFNANDSSAIKKYLGKVVTVKGQIKKIDHDQDGYYTIVLGDTSELSSVLCAMDTLHKVDAADLNKISSVSVKGYFISFERDETGLLGSDVKLNRCIVQKPAH